MSLIPFARKLRRGQTEAELKLWLHLRNRRLVGLKFRRQVPILGFIADFVCEDIKVIVELDGGQHDEQAGEDAERTRALESAGYQVLRFWNNDVIANIESVLQRIVEMAEIAGHKAQS